MQPQTPRVVLLGASNLAMGLGLAVDAARAQLGGSVEVLAAPGRGRSYGTRSSFLVRELVGIGDCGLWAELGRRPAAPTWFVATDLGNDLAFGSSAQQVEAWVERALARLVERGARGVVTGLPLARLERLRAREFELFRRLLFPFHRIDRARVMAEARELEERSKELARRLGIAHVRLEERWYGADPIHFARGVRAEVWRTLVAPWAAASSVPSAQTARSGWLWYERSRVAGLPVGRAQPCARLADGTTFSLY